ncbi:transketolase C-terminal domain-containing protein [uncultured Desulfobacter sp.]|uniref:transketolase family protein n=1 Tax=uncultured Desulfobacter sp. TaxID=240139 RepID=UPI002AAC3F76|nr:transketolase C-terminal domain-containing protein [uncultured Desulfobacter sp.]
MTLIATRDAFGQALCTLGANRSDVVVVSCDLSGATRTKRFAEEYPDRFFEFGIAEQNALSASAGLALEGLRPFISSFGAFIASRVDQIRTSCAFNGAGVVIVGTHSGLAIGKDGATQMGLDDLSLMSSIPTMNIYSPADAFETEQIVEYLCRTKDLAYLRISRKPLPKVLPDTYRFEAGKGYLFSKGRDCMIVATGDMVYYGRQVRDKLAGEGVDAGLMNISTLKPIDAQLILDCAAGTSLIITVEDHSVIGGLGSRVCEVIAGAGLPVPVKRIGIKDTFGESGSPEKLYKKHLLDEAGIYTQITSFLEAPTQTA